jgi:hypothetical protein
MKLELKSRKDKCLDAINLENHFDKKINGRKVFLLVNHCFVHPRFKNIDFFSCHPTQH